MDQESINLPIQKQQQIKSKGKFVSNPEIHETMLKKPNKLQLQYQIRRFGSQKKIKKIKLQVEPIFQDYNQYQEQQRGDMIDLIAQMGSMDIE